jgi:dTMP kinase
MPFLVFEGLDGSGKSTLIKALAQELQIRGKEVVVTREPGGTPLGEEIRRLLLEAGPRAPTARAELLLYEAGRAQHVDQLIRPALEQKKWVLCDRFTASTLAFQCGGRNLPEEKVRPLNDFATQGVEPELTVYLDVTVGTSVSRRAHREVVDRFEMEQEEFHQRVRDHYLSQVKAAPEKWLVLSAEKADPQAILKTLVQSLESHKWL